MALHSMTENWLNAINNKLITVACFIDLSKCFDSVQHSILISKLCNFGITGIEQSWFASYLNHRSQIVKCETRLSSKEFITIGIPEGTILGPVLFNLYVNDLPSEISHGNVTIYADDISLDCSAPSLVDAEINLQKLVDNVTNWISTNRLVVNINKINLKQCLLVLDKMSPIVP